MKNDERKMFITKMANTENKARKALKKQIKTDSRKYSAEGEVSIWKTSDGKYIAHTNIIKK